MAHHDRRTFLAGVAAATLTGGASRTARASGGALLVSVLTCRRPHGVSYLRGTLASIDAEISADVPRLLVCDGEEPSALGTGVVTTCTWNWTSAVVPARARRPGRLPDNKIPGWVAIRAAWTMGMDLLFCEDDIRPLRRGAFAEMAAHEVPQDAAFTSFFARDRAAGRYGAREFMYSQAVKIPHRSLGALVEAEQRKSFQWQLVVGVDLAISAVGAVNGWTFEQTDNLVEHIGLYSAANPT